MPHRLAGWLPTLLLVSTLSLSPFGSAQSAADSGDHTIDIGWTAWADAEFVTKLAKHLIEQRTDNTVKLHMASIGVQYQGVADGSLDLMMMAWLPDSQAAYWNKVKNRVDDLGTIYDGAQLGWVVPDYVPRKQLDSIADLKKPSVQKKLDGRIQGIDPGAGIMQLSKKTLKAYDLKQDYRLISASGAAMTAALKRAEDRKQWIVVTGWTPHWMMGKWHLRFLKDPRSTLGKPQHVDVLARQDFSQDHPQVARMLSQMYIPLDELQKAMYSARKTSVQAAIKQYIAHHQSRIDGWFADTSSH